MRIALSVYTTHAYREILLPATDNTDFSVNLSRNVFGMQADLPLRLEVMNHQWRFKESKYYTVWRQGKELGHQAIACSDVLTIINPFKEKIAVVVTAAETPFSVFQKYDISYLNQITIGTDPDNLIRYQMLSLVSRHHALLKKEGEDWVLEDTSSNGIFINERRLHGSARLQTGDCISIYGLKIVYLDQRIALYSNGNSAVVDNSILPLHYFVYSGPADNEKDSIRPKQYFNRSPRKLWELDMEPVDIEAPPAPKAMAKRPLFMVIGPSFTMAIPMLLGSMLAVYSSKSQGRASSAFMYTGIITVVGAALLGVFWALVNIRYQKRLTVEEEKRRFSAYSNYLVRQVEDIREKYEKSRSVLLEMYPAAETCLSYGRESTVLWERNRSHKDFLEHRLGLGTLPFQVPIQVPKERFSMVEDSLTQQPAVIKKEYENLLDVPVRVNLLEHRLVGILGGVSQAGALNIMHILSAQIAANNCYTDVKLVYIYDGRFDQEEWSFAKWLPHVWSADRKSRYVASSREESGDVFYELVKIFRARTEEDKSGTSGGPIPKPYYIMFVSDPALLEGELIAKYVYEGREQTGLTTIIMAQNYDQLPNACEFIIEDDDTFSGCYAVTDEERQEIKFDRADGSCMEKFSRRLLGIEVKEIEKGGDIPNTLTFFDMYGTGRLNELNVTERWMKNRTFDSMRVPVGMKAGRELCYLDAHEKYHGPHGLVAGTTGSGKSETLQTYILSLALNFSPDDINFFIIDYKGGGMANLFDGLPHMIGQISNLSGNQVRRAMVSIKSENKRRQKIFNENNVNNINSYTKLYKSGETSLPIPHLFIIIDEFAELKREESDFMKEIISVAQVGRSLGVHLILATQKPSGTVDDNIWSNSKFRMCLRVQDRQDSNDMLHKPDAAYITQSGRCYLQVGNDELYELFQSAWSGAAYMEDGGIVKNDIAAMLSLTGHAALTGSKQKRKQQAKVRATWISNLMQIMLQTAVDRNQSIKELAQSTDGLEAVYVQLEHFGEDYAKTDYNSRRLYDLLQLYSAMLEAMPGEDTQEFERVVEEVIKFADSSHIKLPEKKTKTQLDAVVEYLALAAKEKGFVHKLQLWLPPLPGVLILDELEGISGRVYENGTWTEHEPWTLNVPVGLLDDPVSQAQMPLVMDFAEDGHHAVCGMVVCGKSTFLQTMIYGLIRKYSPAHISIYAIDFSSRMLAAFEKAPHTGGIVYEDDSEKIAKLFHMMEQIMEERKQRFKGGNYIQFVKTNGVEVPAIILAIDNYDSFREKTDNSYDDMMVHLAHDGAAYGIFLVLTAGGFGTSQIQSKVGDSIKRVICLQMNDKFQYSDSLRVTRIENLPEANVKGRGLVVAEGKVLEFQTALALKADNDYERMETIETVCMDMHENWHGKTARHIPVIPREPVWSEYIQLDEVQEMLQDDRHLPLGYDMESADIYGIDLSRIYCYQISGRARTGKTNAMKLLMQVCSRKGGSLCVIEHGSDELMSYTRRLGGNYIGDQKSQAEFFQSLVEPFKKRNGIKRALMEEGREDDVYEAMKSEERYYIFISDITSFVQSVMHPEEGIMNIRPFIENITEKGSGHNVFFFAICNPDKVSPVVGMRIYENMTGFRTGIHLGGNVTNVRALDFSHISYTEQSRTQKPGIGMLPLGNNEDVRNVVLPLMKGE